MPISNTRFNRLVKSKQDIHVWYSGNRDIILLSAFWVCIMAATIALRVFALSHQAVWFDEVISVIDAKRPVLDIIKYHATSSMEPHPPLYYILLHYWMLLFGSGEVAIRSLSIIFGVIAIPLMYVVARKILDRNGAFVATVFLVFSPFHIYYSQEARMYSIAFLLSILTTLFMLWLVEGRKYAIIGFAVTSLVSIYILYFAGLLLVAQNLFVFAFYWRKKDTLKRWLFAQGLVVVGYAPWLIVFLRQFGYRTTEIAGQYGTTIKMPIHTLVDFSIGFNQEIWLLVVCAVLYGLIIAAAFWRAKSNQQYSPAPFFLFGVPIFLALLISLKTDFYVTRGLIIALFAYIILLASGVAAFKSRVVQTCLLAAILLVSLHSLHSYYFGVTPISDPSNKYINLRNPAMYVKEHARKDDAILNSYVMCYYPFIYYGGDRNQILLGENDKIQLVKDSFSKIKTGSSQAVARRYKRIWLVKLMSERQGDPWLDKQARVVSKKDFYGVTVRLYEVNSRNN